MACGVTTVINSVTVTCDNAGTSAHAGNHSGVMSQTVTVFGRAYNWSSQRVYWKAVASGGAGTGGTATLPGRQKAAVLGESDFA
jgi:hypothetical protein